MRARFTRPAAVPTRTISTRTADARASPGTATRARAAWCRASTATTRGDGRYEDFNDPRLNQIEGGLAKTGSYPHCESPEGVCDCVGNLHEWTSDPPDANGHGRFRGGFYGDAEINGHGCDYVTRAHPPRYHDYSTGFRCCADPPDRAQSTATQARAQARCTEAA